MCGLFACFEPGRLFPPALLDAADRDLLHRGPDSGGRTAEPGFALVARRLAILDPTAAADQPLHDAGRGLTLVFNGEIYNFRGLRTELEAKGAHFRTAGDGEVLLQGYAHWGEEVVDRLEGMYAFVLIDRRRGIALAARDPFGIKPLYRAQRGGLIAFASTMRPLARLVPTGIDEAALAELLTFGWAAGGLSNLAGVARVPGGTLVRVPLAGGAVTERRFADPLAAIGPGGPMTPAEAEAGIRAALEDSVHAHLASDVGYALQLSGGVDSSLMAALAVRAAGRAPASFGVALPGSEHDEARWRAPVVAKLGLDHSELPLDGRAFAEALPRAVAHMEGPLPHLGCALLMLLCDRVRARTKVVLTGEGADEMFGGYLRYGQWRKLAWQERIGALLPMGLLPDVPPFRGVRRFAGRDAAAYAGVYVEWPRLHALFPGLVPGAGAREAASRRFQDFRDRLLAVDRAAYLESLLVRQDKMAMAASVEARVPYVHGPLAKAIDAVPRAIRIPGGVTKPLLKRIAEAELPHDLIYRRKVGLRLPTDTWLADAAGLGRYLDDLTAPGARLAGYARPGVLAPLVTAFRKGERGTLCDILMRLVNVETWLRSLDVMPVP